MRVEEHLREGGKQGRRREGGKERRKEGDPPCPAPQPGRRSRGRAHPSAAGWQQSTATSLPPSVPPSSPHGTSSGSASHSAPSGGPGALRAARALPPPPPSPLSPRCGGGERPPCGGPEARGAAPGPGGEIGGRRLCLAAGCVVLPEGSSRGSLPVSWGSGRFPDSKIIIFFMLVLALGLLYHLKRNHGPRS